MLAKHLSLTKMIRIFYAARYNAGMKENAPIRRILDSLSFLLPGRLIKKEHLSRRDVIAVKQNLCSRLSALNLITSFLLAIANIVIFIVLGFFSSWQSIETYGTWTFIGQIMGMSGSIIVFTMHLLARFNSDKGWSHVLSRIGIDLFFVIILSEIIVSLYTDSMMGYATGEETISPSILLISALLLSQSPYWLDALFLDGMTSATVIAVSLMCHSRYNLGGIGYYMLVAIIFPIFSYLIVCLLFFAECKNYCQGLQNERLYNSALYDELTKCKNRTALKHFIDESKAHKLSRDSKLLLVMFDIDNFKLYNDQFSHPGGDNCLRMVCEGIRKAFPSPNLDFYRYGGEEFLLFFEVEDRQEAAEIMEKVRRAVEEVHLPAPKGAPKEYVTISVGGTLFQGVGEFRFDSLLDKVDQCLYQAKNSGKDVSCLDGRIFPQA